MRTTGFGTSATVEDALTAIWNDVRDSVEEESPRRYRGLSSARVVTVASAGSQCRTVWA